MTSCGECYSITEFKCYLGNPDDLSSKQNWNSLGWVFWSPKLDYYEYSWLDMPEIMTLSKIRKLMEVAAQNRKGINMKSPEYMLQFWELNKDGFLTTAEQPFAVVGPLYKGYSWYRKLCHAKEGGPVGRAYLSRKPESSPDLRLYSVEQFPLRNETARCGLRSCMALPLFNLHVNEIYYGVLEFLSPKIDDAVVSQFIYVEQATEAAGVTSTHIPFLSIIHNYPENHQPGSEITEMMYAAMELVPQLHLIQLWSPCTQCANNLSCMKRIAFIEPKHKAINQCNYMDMGMLHYLEACGFHHLQIESWIGKPLMSSADHSRKSCFCRNICDFSILENPLAHYAQRARLSSCFVVLLQNNNNHHLVEFFFPSNSTADSNLHLLLKIMEKELTSFKFDKSIVEIRRSSSLTTYEYVEWKDPHSEEVDMSVAMEGHIQMYYLTEFQKYLQNAPLYSAQPCGVGWLFWREEDGGVNYNTQKKIKKIMMAIATQSLVGTYAVAQFWALGMKEGRPCLETSDQPFFLASLYKALAFFRKQSAECHYFVDEQVGPLQHVFQSRRIESSPDLRLYTAAEFPLRAVALHCHLTTYLAFPILDQHKNCIGVLEYFGLDIKHSMRSIVREFEATRIDSTDLINSPTDSTLQVNGSRSLADTEMRKAFELFSDIPQLAHAEVWVTNKECDGISSDISCMELFQSLDIYRYGLPSVKFRTVQSRKGIAGMVLASENKSFFCRNLSDFSIADEPQAHYHRQQRLDVCFVICLQSSHTGDLLYVLPFFLFQGPTGYEYISSFLHILFPILQQQLTSFKVASGQQLGDDLVIDVIEFPQRNQLTSSELDDSYSSPFKFRTVLFGQKELPHSNTDVLHFVPNVEDSVPSAPRAKPSKASTSDPKEMDMPKEKVGKKRNGSLHIRLEDLQPHFGKKIDQAAEELGVGRSTIKRACRIHGIDRWPSSQKYVNNPSLFEAAGTSNAASLPPSKSKTTVQPATDIQPESKTVMVKASYEDVIIKFKLCLSSTMKSLLDEVGRRLDLEIGSFKLEYVDEDNDKILLVCDDDLQMCLESLMAGEKTSVQVFVHLTSK